jgi:hypothetical protein
VPHGRGAAGRAVSKSVAKRRSITYNRFDDQVQRMVGDG